MPTSEVTMVFSKILAIISEDMSFKYLNKLTFAVTIVKKDETELLIFEY